MGEIAALIIILLVATAVFEVVWRVAFGLLFLGPGAWAGIIAASHASEAGANWMVTIVVAAGVFYVVSRGIILLMVLCARAIADRTAEDVTLARD